MKRSTGHGFCLKAGPEQKGEAVEDIDCGSPTDAVGLKNNDLIVAANENPQT